MELKAAFAASLRNVRTHRCLTQEDFTGVSSRTNISLLERGRTIPTLEKLDQLCTVLKIHPVTLMLTCYSLRDGRSIEDLQGLINEELGALGELAELGKTNKDLSRNV